MFFFVTLYIYLLSIDTYYYFFLNKIIKKINYKLQVGKSLYTPQKNVIYSTNHNKSQQITNIIKKPVSNLLTWQKIKNPREIQKTL